MQKLLVQQANVDYYGLFTAPAFSLIGEMRQIIEGLSEAFSANNVGLGNFRLDGDVSEPSSASVTVRLGSFGLYKFKFEQVQASLGAFSDDDLEGFISVIAKGNKWLREKVNDFSFRSHIFSYASHNIIVDTTSTAFLTALPRRSIPIPGEDLGSGLLETWHDKEMNARIRLSLDHSLQTQDGLYISYMVVFDRDGINYVDDAHRSRKLLEQYLANVNLQFSEQ
jgi:hypothetical protein